MENQPKETTSSNNPSNDKKDQENTENKPQKSNTQPNPISEVENNISDEENSALSNSALSENDIETIDTRTEKKKTMDLDNFYKQSRHYFIMTEGGTPIYSRYGDEILNCSVLATFSAIITKFTVFNGGQNNEEESLNYIKNEYSLTVFMKKGKLFFIAISNKNDSVSFLYSQLELLYNQLLSVITNDRIHNLEEKPSTCSKLLSGTNILFEQIIEYTSHSMVGLLKSYQVLPIDNRSKLNEICTKYRGEALITCIMTKKAKEIIAISKSNLINLTFGDVALIQCLIMTSNSLRENECWVPICLPGISADGFLQFYSNFLPPNEYGIIYVTERQEQKSFSNFTDLSRKIYDEIQEKGYLPFIEKAIETKNNAEFIEDEIKNNNQEINIETLKEFIKSSFGNKQNIKTTGNNNLEKEILNDNINAMNILTNSMSLNDAYKNYTFYKKGKEKEVSSRLVSMSISATKYNTLKNDPMLKINYGIVKHRIFEQFFTINLHSHDKLTKEEKYVYKTYVKLFDFYNSVVNSIHNADSFFHIEKDNKFSHGIYVTETFMIFGTFNYFKPNDEITEIFKNTIKLIKQFETNFFISFK